MNIISHPPEARGLRFCPVLFYLFFLGLCRKVAGTVVHLRDVVLWMMVQVGDLVLARGVTQAPAGGCHVNNVR